MRISLAYDRLLRGDDQVPLGIAQLHLATAKQIMRLHYKAGSEKFVTKRLMELVRGGYLQCDAMAEQHRTGNRITYSARYYYTLAQKGKSYVGVAGKDREAVQRAVKRTSEHDIFIRHSLEVNDLLISAMLIRRVAPAFWLEDFQSEHELKQHPYKIGRSELAPDLYLNLQTRDADGLLQRPMVLEHDRATEDQYDFRGKVRKYLVFLRQEGYRQMFGVSRLTVVFTTFKGQEHAERLQRWTKAEVGSEPIGRLFYFAALQPPLSPSLWLEPCWFTVEGGPHALLAM
ncbi:MAG TPA: replication-relaxation family protein [Ktedonobacterales bacterium]|nr:replication-relaxation family protein [Ktedonobacterales bacterium]